jgi:ABC-2 type transport system ATP-binding protein
MIEVRHLSKSFVKYEKEKGLWGMIKGFVNAKKVITKAVDDVSFSIAKGEVIGYIGANGAGKSTTIKMLTGILTPTSGEVTVDGVIPTKTASSTHETSGSCLVSAPNCGGICPSLNPLRSSKTSTR